MIRECFSVTCNECNASHGAFQTRAEQAQCTLQARACCDDSLASGHQRQLSSVLCYQDSHVFRIYRNSRSLSISVLLSIRNNGVTGVFSYQKGNNLTVSHRGLYILSLNILVQGHLLRTDYIPHGNGEICIFYSLFMSFIFW